MRFLEDQKLSVGQKVLVRCDLDVALAPSGEVAEPFRLDCARPTLAYIIAQGAHPIIAGHLGKPNGKVDVTLSTKLLQPYFESNFAPTDLTLLENLRFDSREEANDSTLAQELATLADSYVNESFATCHRAHASIVGLPKFLPAFAGLRLQQEVTTLAGVLTSPVQPVVAIVGGAKLESKLPVISKFLEICDYVLVGGLLHKQWVGPIPPNLILASDEAHAGKDIGAHSIDRFTGLVATAKTVIWAGPLGLYEQGYSTATKAVAEAVLSSKAQSIVGGGDTIAALNSLGLLDQFSFVSSGGSAMLEFLVKGTLPGLEALGYRP